MTRPDTDAYQKGFDAHLVRRILHYVRPYLPLVIGGVLLALLISLASPLFALIQRHAIDAYLSRSAPPPSHPLPAFFLLRRIARSA